ncbi:MAG: proline racemase family protein [Candidatus Sulfotelmatobacter sp.]
MTDGKHQRVRVIDSHTGGEPTRVIVSGGPDLGTGLLSDRLQRFRQEHDSFRSAVVNEPRGSDVMVGALLCEPVDPACAAGVIFFNNVGYLGMCGHGTIGLMALREGQVWKQESIVGSVFEGSVTVRDGKLYPSIKGAAFVNADADLVLDSQDPFCVGIRA